PELPGLYRKLGLTTYEHLRDYKETALVYLQKALDMRPDDAEVMLALADNAAQMGQADEAAQLYTRAVAHAPHLRSPEHDRFFLKISDTPTLPPHAEPALPPAAPEAAQPSAEEPTAAPPMEPQRQVLTVLITGATSGIGRATAEEFARHGHRLLLTGRRTDRLSQINRELQDRYGTDVLLLPFDVRDRDTVQHIFEALPSAWRDIDVLLNNAGLAKGLAPVHEADIDHWETMIDTNLKGVLYVTRAVAQGMVRRRRGHIINISSSAGKEAYANGSVYCATKFAIEALTRAIRLDLHKHNIRVSQVSPGHVEETEFAITRFDGDAERARIYDDFQPLRARDVAEAIYFIATRPAHVNVQDIWMFGTQQASATVIDRSGRE
ncbi:MAG TPA: SDR family NAD(P)-dependent oxidoreductase, partial [Saprospiraceae bacterium]|nr:SDR family NAD(P)-dependent oxidoreductase [Saprospiraceae bacterium]